MPSAGAGAYPMRIDIVTIFTTGYWDPLDQSIVGRARRAGQVQINVVDLREYSDDRHASVDDRPFGGGPGMVIKPEPLFRAVESLRAQTDTGTETVLVTPQGQRFTQAAARAMSAAQHLILVCGHYEGVDERARQALFDREVSVGDFILTNANLAAVMITDAVVRLLPGVLGSDESAVSESFARDARLDFAQFTRPAQYRGMNVPQVLLSGDHGRIERWRQRQRTVRTAARRPDMMTDSSMEVYDECS